MRHANIPHFEDFAKSLCGSCKRRLAKVVDVAALKGATSFDFGACDKCNERMKREIEIGDHVIEAKS